MYTPTIPVEGAAASPRASYTPTCLRLWGQNTTTDYSMRMRGVLRKKQHNVGNNTHAAPWDPGVMQQAAGSGLWEMGGGIET